MNRISLGLVGAYLLYIFVTDKLSKYRDFAVKAGA